MLITMQGHSLATYFFQFLHVGSDLVLEFFYQLALTSDLALHASKVLSRQEDTVFLTSSIQIFLQPLNFLGIFLQHTENNNENG